MKKIFTKLGQVYESLELDESVKMNLLFIFICALPLLMLFAVFLMFS
jgi:hypothetical protein